MSICTSIWWIMAKTPQELGSEVKAIARAYFNALWDQTI